MSLAPRLIKWQHMKADRFKYLAVAAAALFFTLAASMFFADRWLSSQMESLEEGMTELRECDALVPKLDAAMQQIEYQQKLLVPIVEQGGRSKILIRAISELTASMCENDWCFYFADEFSYADSNAVSAVKPVKDGNEAGGRQPEDGRPRRRPSPFDMFGMVHEPPPAPEAKEADGRVVVAEMPLLSSMYVGGFVLRPQNGNRYTDLLLIQKRLRECGFFSEKLDTDVSDWQGVGLKAFTGWSMLLGQQRAALGEYVPFKLKLPLARPQIDFPPEKEAKGDRSRNRNRNRNRDS